MAGCITGGGVGVGGQGPVIIGVIERTMTKMAQNGRKIINGYYDVLWNIQPDHLFPIIQSSYKKSTP